MTPIHAMHYVHTRKYVIGRKKEGVVFMDIRLKLFIKLQVPAKTSKGNLFHMCSPR